MLVLYRARWSFVGQTRSLMDTGRLMARWGEQAAALVAPSLEWTAAVEAHADYALTEAWEASHVVRFEAGTRGEGRAQLVAGGRGTKVGGSGRVSVASVDPFAYFDADGHCDVEHWDVSAGGVSEPVIEAARVLLEAEVGAPAAVVVHALERFERGPALVARTADEDEARLWAGDLDDAGIAAGVERDPEGWVVRARAASIASLAQLVEARVTLGEVLGEAGHDDWAARAQALLARLPHSS
ncbi:MAG: hypothetical protein KF729_17945 [Sandaracinaceae bacterium]|nr:hypothetical protein [Sandaracinaceae bacterium]